MECLLCGKELHNNGFAFHLKSQHDINTKDYYDMYFKQPGEGICKNCGKETSFIGLHKGGYHKYCSVKCSKNHIDTQLAYEKTCLEKYGVKNTFQTEYTKQQIKKSRKQSEETLKLNNIKKYGVTNTWQRPDVIQKIKLTNKDKNFIFERENNCTLITTLVKLYGTGWKQSKILNIPRIYYNNVGFIDNKYIEDIQNYYKEHNKGCASIYELELYDLICSTYNGNVLRRTRKVISPQELDIYIPELKLAIEFNGTYWHNCKDMTHKDYHLNKSLLCRDNGIRLIHIYQFEDFEKQKQLLKDLLLGQDNYPKNDFNKNNLIDIIPKSEIIYNKDDQIIYGAGHLIKI